MFWLRPFAGKKGASGSAALGARSRTTVRSLIWSPASRSSTPGSSRLIYCLFGGFYNCSMLTLFVRVLLSCINWHHRQRYNAIAGVSMLGFAALLCRCSHIELVLWRSSLSCFRVLTSLSHCSAFYRIVLARFFLYETINEIPFWSYMNSWTIEEATIDFSEGLRVKKRMAFQSRLDSFVL